MKFAIFIVQKKEKYIYCKGKFSLYTSINYGRPGALGNYIIITSINYGLVH